MTNSSLDVEYTELEKLFVAMKEAESRYYQLRYATWKMIAMLKKRSPIKETYKQFEGKVRRDCKKRQRRGLYGDRPRGHQLDHYFIPVIYAYCAGIENLDIINGKDNCRWVPPAKNTKKGICRGVEE